MCPVPDDRDHRNQLNLNNPPKFYIVILSLLCITGLMLTGSISSESGLGLLGLIVGYAVGNGIAARGNEPVEPMIGRRDSPDPHHDE